MRYLTPVAFEKGVPEMEWAFSPGSGFGVKGLGFKG